MKYSFTIKDIDKAAKVVLEALGDKKVLALEGEMGAGKTTLSQEICRQLGVTSSMSSPTFSIINEYEAGNGDSIYHLDLYRLKDEEEAINAGVEDTLYSGKYCLVEWPAIAKNIFPAETMYLYIKAIGPTEREIEIL